MIVEEYTASVGQRAVTSVILKKMSREAEKASEEDKRKQEDEEHLGERLGLG